MYYANITKLQKLNNILDEWASQFENKPGTFLTFEVTANNMLSANGVILAPMEQIAADDAAWDVEFLEIPLTTGAILEIGLQWGFDEPCPTLGYVSRTELLYRAPAEKNQEN